MKDLFDSNETKYLCPNCNKQYKTSDGIQRHKKVHEFSFDSEDQLPASGKDHVAICRTFMKCTLLLRDTNDAHRWEQGKNKCKIAYASLSSWKNTTSISLGIWLTSDESYHQQWRTSTCGIAVQTWWYGENIPNLQLTRYYVPRAALMAQIKEEIKQQNLQTQCNKKKLGSRETSNILEMVTELKSVKIFTTFPYSWQGI